MTIFAVMMPSPQPTLVAEIVRIFPKDHLLLSETQYLISSGVTAGELAAKLGVFDPAQPTKATGLAVIFATASYSGRAATTVWEWIKTKLETPPSG